MTNDINSDISDDEYVEDLGGVYEYGNRPNHGAIRGFAANYKIWNANPEYPDADKTPGVVMTTKEYKGKDEKGEAVYEKKVEVVESVRAIILFSSAGRELGRGRKASFRVVCSSHDGEHPSLRIDQPLCGKATSEDVAKIISQWKGYDEAKINAKVKEVTEGGKLAVCGLKAKSGHIMLCPYARKDPDTGQFGGCKSHIYVRGYDLDREREFDLKLTGASIDNGQFIAPYHQFFMYLAATGKEVSGRKVGLPCYFFEVKLSALPRKAFFLANVSDYTPVRDKPLREKMKGMAEAAKERYLKQAARLSKEAYDKAKGEQKRIEPVIVSEPPKAPSVADVKPAMFPVVPSPVAAVSSTAGDEDPFAEFDADDDIPF